MPKNNLIDDTPAPMVDSHAKTLSERVADYLGNNDWRFSVAKDGNSFAFWLRLRDASVRVCIDTLETNGWARILVYGTYPTYVPAPRRQAVADAIARVNYTCVLGNLEQDMNDGEVRVRTTLEGDGHISELMIDRAVRRCLELADQYLAPLLAIAFGNASPTDVLAMASRGEAATLQ